MRRHAKSLQKKARGHKVYLGRHKGTFIVVSGSSGEPYTVWALANGGFRCPSCEWGKWHPRDECSHILSVRQWLETSGHRSLSFWASETDAQRQHRPTEQVSSGLWATSRKRTLPKCDTGLPLPVEYSRGRSKLFKN